MCKECNMEYKEKNNTVTIVYLSNINVIHTYLGYIYNIHKIQILFSYIYTEIFF